MSAFYAPDNYLLRKTDEDSLQGEINEILRAKIPKVLPCEDCPVGIKLSEPVFDGGRVRLSIPGFLTLDFGLINPYL
jgi:hypothetical protein